MKDKSEPGTERLSFPFYAKASYIIIGLFVFLYMMYIAQGIIIPVVFSVMIAIIPLPLVEFFKRRLHIHRIISILLAITICVSLVSGVVLLVFSQASLFIQSWPEIVDKFGAMLNRSVDWLSHAFRINPGTVNDLIDRSKDQLLGLSSNAIGQTLLTVGNALVILFLIPVYVFLILYYQPLLKTFLKNLFGSENKEDVSIIANETRVIIQKYLVGLIIEFLIIACLNTLGLWILGIQYALLLGIIGSLLNIVPYVGGIIGVALYMMVALVTKSPPTYSLLVFALYAVIQFIDNNIIVPHIVASKVRINALISIIVVIAGGLFWGISGMFLSIPIIAIVKLIFDRIDQLKPWGYLLGDTIEYNKTAPQSYIKIPEKTSQNTSRFPQ